jgi:hypothetical protein
MENETRESEIEVRRYADPYFFNSSLASGPFLSLFLWISVSENVYPRHGKTSGVGFRFWPTAHDRDGLSIHASIANSLHAYKSNRRKPTRLYGYKHFHTLKDTTKDKTQQEASWRRGILFEGFLVVCEDFLRLINRGPPQHAAKEEKTHVMAVKRPASNPYFLVTSSTSLTRGFSSSCTCIFSPEIGRTTDALRNEMLWARTVPKAGTKAFAAGIVAKATRHRHAILPTCTLDVSTISLIAVFWNAS